MVATALEPVRTRTGTFYIWMAGACALIAFGSFAGTYWLQLPAGTFVGAPIVHLHAGLFSAWTLLFLTQTLLAGGGDIRTHRALGMAGVSLATAMLFVGLAAAINSVAVASAAGFRYGAVSFMVVPVTAITLFAALFAAAVANIGRPEWHKRLMLVATISLLQAALARVFFLVATGGGPGLRPGLGKPQPVAITLPPGAVVDLLIAVAMIYDWRTRGRPHPAYWIAGGLTLAVQLGRLPLSATPAWHAIGEGLALFGR